MKKYIYEIEDEMEIYCRKKDGTIKIEKNVGDKKIIEIELKENVKMRIADIDEIEENKDWLKINEKLGEFGEELFIKYLLDIGYEIKQVSKISSSYGYDILAEKDGVKKYYEVKTNSINITTNEIKIAKKYLDDYFLVLIADGKVGIEGIIIKNPIRNLELDKVNLKIYESENILLSFNSISIELKESFINKFEKLDLDSYSNYKTINEVIKKY